jgi:predicted dehydrogenase
MEPEEVRRVVEATQSSDRVVAISYQSRYRRDSRLLRAALQSGRWGNITSIDIFASEDWITPNIGTWRHDPARCPGGYFGDANGHQLDVLFWMTDLEPEWVRATTETRGTPVPMVTWGEARLRGQRAETRDRTLPFTFSFVGDARIWREEISIITEKADFVIRDTQLLWSEGSGPLAPFSANILENDELSDPNLPDLPDSAFVAALRGGPPVLSAPETVWPVLRFTRSALASASNGSQAQSALTY